MNILARTCLAASATALVIPSLAIEQCGGDDDDPIPFDLDFPLELADARIHGVSEYQWAGRSVGPLGDFNGDGRPDFGISTFDNALGGTLGVFFSETEGELYLTEADVTFSGEYSGHDAGQSIGAVGPCDINGDGIDDLLISSRYADVEDVSTTAFVSGDNRGKAYIFFGGAWNGQVDLSQADVQLYGENDGDAAGMSLACLGDLDDDGYDDYAVGAEHSDRNGIQSGTVYVEYGSASRFSPIELANAPAKFFGEAEYDFAGHSLNRVGDVNGDAVEDFVIGAYGNDEGGAEAGKVYLILGSRTRWSGDLPLASVSTSFIGIEGLRLGFAAGLAGDFDRDGYDEILLGSFGIESGKHVVGTAYMLYGRSSLASEYSLSSIDVTFEGEYTGDVAGRALASAGDINADGFSDILVGALNGRGSEENAGKTYLIYGRSSRLSGTVPLAAVDASFLGENSYDWAGETLNTIGDSNLDGRDDFIITARAHDEGVEQSGTSYVFFGR